MGTKLGKSAYPSGHGPSDFKCSGPPATKDAEFMTCKLADMGCFTQEGKDTNKYYCAQICKSKLNSKSYVYFEWGRTGATNPQFQFVECSDEADAQEEFNDQLMDKNAKRGEWTDIGGIRTLRAKSGKDCYLVRTMASRSCGLPDGRAISLSEPAKPAKAAPGKSKTASTVKIDSQTHSLMRDLNVATVQYTRSSIVGGAVPAQSSIDEARTFLTEAEKLVLKIGGNIDDQLKDKDLKQITYALYSRVPKVKPVGAPESTWILSSSNILAWRQDLDAFEGALYTHSSTPAQQEHDPFDGMAITMSWIDPQSDLGRFIFTWWPNSTANKHSHLSGKIKIRNAWKMQRHDEIGKLEAAQQKIKAGHIEHRPPFQPSERNDLVIEGVSKETLKTYSDTNTCLLHHGTRSVNVSPILRTGLRFPQELVGVVISGALLGNGNYNADDIKKSIGYTSHSGSYYASGGGGVKGRGSFMFANDVILGKPYLAPAPHGYTAPPSGYHSIFGKSGHTGHLANNEWVIFSKDQVRLKYLIEFE